MKNRLNMGNGLLGTTRRESPYGCCSNQKGSLFVGLIITIVILGTLGGAMVYVFGSSTFENVVGNFARRAYYAAESGMRFAVATYRNPLATAPETDFANLTGQTISFPNNSSAALTIQKTVLNDVPTTVDYAQTINAGGNLTVASATSFPDKNGFFQIKDVTGYFRYKQRDGNELQLISGPGLSPSLPLPAGTEITSPKDQYSVISKGAYQIAGIFGVSRTVEYGWVLSGRGSGTSEDPVSPEFDPTKWYIAKEQTDRKTGITEYFSKESWGSVTFDTTERALRVYSTQSAKQTRFMFGYNKQFFYDE
ncbi:MAG: hypothetical protein ABIE92_05290, partial [bacterium]